jgi:Flp pilus assembly protein TadG
MFKLFARDTRGSLGIGMALGVTAMIGAVSATLDYSRMTNVRASLAAAVDAAALAGAQTTEDKLSALARQVFDANFREQAAVTSFTAKLIKKDDDDDDGGLEAVRVEAVASVNMSLARAIGFTSAPVRAYSEVVVGNDSDIQMALVLDVTDSMRGTKMDTLKSAATNMVNTMFDKLKKSNQIKMAVVPFGEYVNVGKSNRNQPWIDVPKDSTTTEKVCWQERDVTRTYNCRMVYHEWDEWNDGVVTRRSGTWQECNHDYGPYYQKCDTRTTTLQWDGCVGSRNYPLNLSDANYTITRAPGVMNVNCPPQLTELTPSRPKVLQAIAALSTSGNTYIPAGLTWGWATLSKATPFSEPDNAQRKVQDYLILMTDGANTMSSTYPKHDDYNSSVSDTLTAQLCANIKASGILVFTISFDVNSAILRNQLRICASSPDKYFEATNLIQLNEAFNGITSQVTQMRLSK